MTTRINITNVGPENAAVWYYDEHRQFKAHKDVLKAGQSMEVDIWNGHLPVLFPLGRQTEVIECTRFFRCPPATIGG